MLEITKLQDDEFGELLKRDECQGKIAPNGCWIVRYRARGKGGTYWYYKWQSPEPIFVTKDGQKWG